jgi:hypothetical protein
VKPTKRKLSLSRETIASLDLSSVTGGDVASTISISTVATRVVCQSQLSACPTRPSLPSVPSWPHVTLPVSVSAK